MAVGIGKESKVSSKGLSSREVRAARGRFKQLPGRPIVKIAEGVVFVVSLHRKDLNKVIEQTYKEQRAKLPAYEQSLFESCFKNWKGASGNEQSAAQTTSAQG